MNENFECKLQPTSKLGKTLDRYYSRGFRKYPVVIIVTGEVGTGKSKSLALNVYDYWFKRFHDKSPPAKLFTTQLVKYSVALKMAEVMELAVLDEAMDAFGKGTSSRKIVNAFAKMFGICRGRQVATMVVLDDIFIVTSKLAKYVTCWIHTEKRIDNKCKSCNELFAGFKACPFCGSTSYRPGMVKFRVYSKRRLRAVLQANENRTIKSIYIKGVPANIYSIINEYTGELEEYYNKMKEDKQNTTMDELIKEVKIGTKQMKKAEKEYLDEMEDEKETDTEGKG